MQPDRIYFDAEHDGLDERIENWLMLPDAVLVFLACIFKNP